MTLAPDLALVTEAGVPVDENTDDDAEGGRLRRRRRQLDG